jgi:Photosynthesis system II assembly factor YCF48/Putative zinc-finger
MAELPTSIIARLRDSEKLSDHLDPNLISALLENSLSRADRVRVLEHLAYCSQCREVGALSLPEGLDPASFPSATASWLSWPVLRWSLAGVCVLLVGTVVSLHQRSRSRPLELARTETAAVERARPAPPPLPAVEDEEKGSRQAAHSSRPVREPSAARAPTRSPATTAQESAVASVEVSAEAMTVRTTPGASSVELDEAVPGRAKDVLEEPHAVGAPQAQATMSRSAMAIEKAPKIEPRWTLTSDSTLARSFDSGNTWETVSLPSQARFHVLSAHGMDIWVGGSGGALYHSVDAGKNWVQVQPVAGGQPLTEDVIGMEFVDDDHGVLTTSTNQRWATEDCGQSWQKK